MAAIEIPTTFGFKARQFDIRHAQQVTHPGNSGFIQTINRSAPFWTAEYETPPLSEAQENEARIFIDALEGAIGTFLAYDPKRIMPQAYKGTSEASNPWGATPTVTAQNYAASTINLGSMTVGAIITKGDYISVLDSNNIWHLFRSMQTVTVGGGGTVSSLIVKPRPVITGTFPRNMRYKRACCEMKMIGDPTWDDSVETLPVVRFVGGQFINRAG